jgi:Domain of unknown function (DUF6895)
MAASLERVRYRVCVFTRGRGMKAMRHLLFSLAVMVLPVHAGDKNPAAVLPTGADIDAVIARGTGWLAQHPAAVAGDGLPDMLLAWTRGFPCRRCWRSAGSSTLGRAAKLPPEDVPVQVRSVAALELYALVYEIVALTDFGRQSAPPWLAQRREAVVHHPGEAVAWAAAAGNFDLTAELLMSARLLHEPLTGNYRDAVLAIMAGQQDDGSWGSQTPRRGDEQRHAVLTATTAL